MATTAIYVIVATVALGNLTSAQIQHDQEYVLAVAARPTMGEFGFVLIGIAALLSTASAINATLFGAARLAMVMASDTLCRACFRYANASARCPGRRWLRCGGVARLRARRAAGDHSTFASATFLLIFLAINLSAWHLRRKIGLAAVWPLTGTLLTAVSFALLMAHSYATALKSLWWIGGFYLAAIRSRSCSRSGAAAQGLGASV